MRKFITRSRRSRKTEIVENGNKKSIYQGGQLVGEIEKQDRKWRYSNLLGREGHVSSEKQAFFELGFRVC